MLSDSHDLDDDKYCSDLVRRYDRDRFICSLFAPDDCRKKLLALYAFNIEIAGTRETVTEPTIGHMRLKWWHDALGEIYSGSPPAHQVAVPLSRTVRGAKVDRGALEKLIEARLMDLDDTPPESIDDLIEYAGHTSGGLAEMALSILGVEGLAAQKAGRAVGIAYALTGMIRAMPLNFMRRRVFLPTDLLRQTNLDVDDLLGGGLKEGTPDNLIKAIGVITQYAKAQLREAEDLGRDVPRRGIAAILPGVLVRGHLSELADCGNDPFKLPLRPPGPGVWGMLRLTWASAKGRI